MVDNNISKSIINYSDTYSINHSYNFKPLPIKNLLNDDERKIYSWVDDMTVNNCHQCNIKFTLVNRKHHCRNCGKIYCHNCSNNFISIPNKIKTVDKQYNYLDYKTYLDFLNINNKQERVCSKCYKNILDLKNLNQFIILFNLLSLNINDYKIISMVSKTWYKIAKYYFNQFREIQYNFPDHNYSIKEKQIIFNNKKLLTAHSKLILQLILITDWNNNNNQILTDTLKIIKDSHRFHNCKHMLCTRSCMNKLQIEDIVIIISKNFTYLPLLKYVIKEWTLQIKNTNYNDLEISCYLYVLVNSLHFYKNYTSISIIIENFLLYVSTTYFKISNQLFWMLTSCISDPKSSLYFKEFRIKLVKNLNKEKYYLLQNGFDFTQNIIKVANNNKDNVSESIKNYIKEYNKFSNFVLPLDIEKSFKSINYDEIRVINSKTKPIILPCLLDDNNYCNIMLKKEDIRKEEIIMKLIKLMDYYLQTEENLNLYATTYNILPISTEYGYIEFVPNSTTLYDIKEIHKFSIQNWVLENNKNITIHEFRNNITKSSAFYCIITYLLGIGDRHLENIMITNTGKIFHIDFGYILGTDPKIISPEIRLTPDMIDAMGGLNSEYYIKFKHYCGICYNCIRRHTSIFYVLLSEIVNLTENINDKYYWSKDKIKYYIINRFIPGENYEDAIKQINYRIETNSNTYSETVIDYFHKKYKLSSESDKTTDNNIIHIAKDVFKYTWKKHVKKHVNKYILSNHTNE